MKAEDKKWLDNLFVWMAGFREDAYTNLPIERYKLDRLISWVRELDKKLEAADKAAIVDSRNAMEAMSRIGGKQ